MPKCPSWVLLTLKKRPLRCLGNIRADYPVASYITMTENSATQCEDLKERSKQNAYLCKIISVSMVEYNSAS